MKRRLLDLIACPNCKGNLALETPVYAEDEIESGLLRCASCNKKFDIIKSIPWLLDKSLVEHSDKLFSPTSSHYGYLWDRESKSFNTGGEHVFHFENMSKAVPFDIVRGTLGIDVGCGGGGDTYFIAKNNPGVELVAVDLSEGVYAAKGKVKDLPNVHLARASALSMPFRDSTFDFAYSYGVLHHTPEPCKGLSEMKRITKKDAHITLYLYEDHSDNFVKYLSIKCIGGVRKFTTKLPNKALWVLSNILSPFVVLVFSVPARLLNKFKATQKIAQKMPFNFGRGPFSLAGDLYDRLGAKFEHRFSKKQLEGCFNKLGFKKFGITRMPGIAGWVNWVIK